MDIDPNDILSTNVYITKPDLHPNISKTSNEEFRRYYEKELKIEQEEKIKTDLKNFTHLEVQDDNILLNTQMVKNDGKSNSNIDRFIRENKTLVSIDSRNRTKTLYPKPSNFKMFLGKTFTNVKKIEMVSLEFPNTDAVINSNNNNIYWMNKEDIDLDITITKQGVVTYPVYSVDLRVGSYTASTLQSEMTNKLNSVRRRQGVSNGNLITGDFHYFVVNLDIDTDVVTFTSLILQQIPNNGFSTLNGSGVITVNFPGHGYSTFDEIYFTGTKSIAGIPATVLNGFHQITVTSSSIFTFEVSTAAADSTSGGGNTIKSGKKAPFQLLWGNQQSTVAQNIGYPLENSSELLVTTITSLQNLYQMNINTVLPHGFTNDYTYIGNVVNVGYILNGLFISYKTYQILDVPSTTSILVQVSDNTVTDSLNNNSLAVILKYSSTLLDISSFSTYGIPSIIVITNTNHNYTLSDIGNTVTLSNTSDPTITNDTSYDGDYVLTEVPSNTSFVIPGVLGIINTHLSGTYGTVPRQIPLTTFTVKIQDIQMNFIKMSDGLYYTKFITESPHKLKVGDYVRFNNIQSNPVLTDNYKITSVLNSTTFLVQLELVNIESFVDAYIGTGLMTVSFPSHNFNNIVNISNGTPYTVQLSLQTITVQPLVIQTLIPHNFKTGDLVRLSGTNTTPVIDGGGYVVTYISSDTFSIIRNPTSFSPLTNIPSVITGIIGLSQSFYIYGSEDIGGISKTLINNMLFNVRDILDVNTFTFMLNNNFATSTETGGGSYVYLSSLQHGFNGVQTNTKNNVLNRSINLQGENYSFLCCPQLDTILNTGQVKNIFARISLDKPPGYVCFNYLSNPKIFNTIPLDKLSELEFSILNWDGTEYNFFDLDFSFCLEITEVSDATNAFNISSRRGITDVS